MVIITPVAITASYLITTIKETCQIKVMYKEIDKKSEKNKF
jgi:hypothetical protein